MSDKCSLTLTLSLVEPLSSKTVVTVVETVVLQRCYKTLQCQESHLLYISSSPYIVTSFWLRFWN